ncbi:Hypothetical predicted protein [Mytilus galloprovincialis]|uniref:Uncharacterized protein n=1 Tax=Mytilus galloprovincialis TaxID=29158 RepID=A0A8B6CT62_MYTGA|nr:Hypothetical predicted protein [Mytilus galloprovincialis]
MNMRNFALLFVLVLTFDVKAQLSYNPITLSENYLNRGCPILNCRYISCPSRCKMPTLYRYNGRLCRGCHINICSSYIQPIDMDIGATQ